MDDQGIEDAAILLISMGEEEAAEVFRHLSPKEAQRLGNATGDPQIASLPNDANTMLFWWMLANQSPAASSAIGDGSGTSFPFLAFLYGPSVLQWSQPSAADNAQATNFANFIRLNGF